MSHPNTEDPAARRGASRRDFLRLAGGAVATGAGAGLILPACGSSKGSAGARQLLPTLHSRSGATTVKGIQHFRSRPDLRPPEIVIDVRAKHVRPGFVFTECHAGPAQQGPLILSETGRLVGFMPLTPKPTPAARAFNVRVQTYQGKPVMTYFEGAVVSAHGQGHYKILDEHYHQVAQVHGGNGYQGDLHEFLLTEQGTALFTAYGEATGTYPGGRRGRYFYGVVQEVDVATGKVLFQWRSDRHVGLAESYYPEPAKTTHTWDYFHVNGITVDPADNNLLISSRNTCAIYKVNRKTGRVIWKLGGKGGNFRLGRGARFWFQHHITLHPGGVLTIFDNEGGPPKHGPSRGLVLKIDEAKKTARVRTQFHHRPTVFSEALGSVQLLDKGHTFMGWGTSSYFTEYGPGGTVLFDGRLLPPGTTSYRAFKQTWTGTPTTAPSLVATRHGKGALLYASWNFATEVAGWAVYTGHAADALAAVGVATLRGFETEITLPQARRFVAVEAIDHHGKVLGRSRPLKV